MRQGLTHLGGQLRIRPCHGRPCCSHGHVFGDAGLSELLEAVLHGRGKRELVPAGLSRTQTRPVLATPTLSFLVCLANNGASAVESCKVMFQK